MIRCLKCNCTPENRPFIRMNPKGEKGIFWCEKCAKENEPEFYKNEKEDESQVEKDLKDIFYPTWKK